MKTTEFLQESLDSQEYNDEAGMAKNSLHTIVRVATHLERELSDNENLPEWVQEKIGAIKEMMVTVMDYMISQHEMGKQEEVPGFDADQAERQFAENLDQGVAEGHADQQRKIFKKNGEPVGEVGIDRESSPGNGQWYIKHYASGKDLAGYDSYEEALAELKHCMKQGVAEESHMFKGPHGHQDVERKGGVTRVTRKDWDDTSQATTDVKGGKYFPNKDIKGQGTGSVASTNTSSLNRITGGSYRKMPRLDHDANDKPNYDFREGRQPVKEEASAGATGSPSVAVSMQTLGEKGSFSRREVNKKLSGYGNQLTRGGPVKVKAVK